MAMLSQVSEGVKEGLYYFTYLNTYQVDNSTEGNKSSNSVLQNLS